MRDTRVLNVFAPSIFVGGSMYIHIYISKYSEQLNDFFASGNGKGG